MSNDVHTLSGAYALDALSDAEAAEFREHLAVCPACWQEVRELRSAAARMGAGAAMTPSPALRERVLMTADRTPQLPPKPQSYRATQPAPQPRRWRTLLAVAASVVVLGGVGAVTLTSGDRSDEPGDLPVAAATVFEAPDARTASFETGNGGELRIAVSPDRDEMAVDARALPELSGEVYQLWALHDGVATSVKVLTEPGAAMPLPDSDTQLAVTVEPEGGSDQPTSKPIVAVAPATV